MIYDGIYNEDELKNIKKCSTCRSYMLPNDNKLDFKICSKCRELSKVNREKNKVNIKCKGICNDGSICNYKPLNNDNYCKLHQSYKKYVELLSQNKIICKNWIRGCWNEINDEFKKCIDCRKNDSDKDKILREKKQFKSIEYNNETKDDNLMCNKCNKIDDKENFKNNKCLNCYIIDYNCQVNRNEKNFFDVKYDWVKKSAKTRNLEFKLSKNECITLFTQVCNYCGKLENVNGIDRINSKQGYFLENCVSCCGQCNFMKNDKDQCKFIKLCEHISSYNKLIKGKLYPNILENTKYAHYNQYIKSANNRNITFELSIDEFIKLISKKCTYCGVSDYCERYDVTGAGGIDRVDSSKGYNLNNCVPCCGICNTMKLDYTSNEFLNKCLEITKKHKLFDINNFEDELKEAFYKINEGKIKIIKEKFNHSKEYYENRVWNGTLDDLKNIKISLELVNNENLRDLWNYYRKVVSSLKKHHDSQNIGRRFEILVKDNETNKYLGILCLSSDYLNLESRDKVIEWSNIEKINNKKINYLMNISTCVPLQPFGFNFNGGKLLTKLIFSQEVQDIFRIKYGHELLGITTTSLYGKSVQYDRLKEIKFIGFTKGNSVYKYPNDFVHKCQNYLKLKFNIEIENRNKLYIISRTLQKLDLPLDDFIKDNPKGIYFGFIYSDSKNYLCNKINKIKDHQLKSTNEIFNEWLNRWAIQRHNYLLLTKRLITINHITSTERSKKSLRKIKEVLGEEEYKKKRNEYMKKYRNKKSLEKII